MSQSESSTRPVNLNRFNDFSKVNRSNHYYLVLKPMNDALIRTSQQYASGKVLDIGCGNKPYEKLFDHCEVYEGCDIVQSSAQKVDHICDASAIPLEDASYDTVFTTQVIEHLADYQGMLKEAFRLLRPGGQLLLSGPMYWHIHEAPHDYYRFTKYGFQHILESLGFEITEIIPNGGKWALFGQVVIHTFPMRLVRRASFRRMVNWVFEKMDHRYFDDVNTTNYVVVAKKPE